MKKDHKNRRPPIRVAAETLRHLGRPELAAVGGGLTTMTQAVGGNTITQAVGGVAGGHKTNVEGTPTGTGLTDMLSA